jgi:hypothetical protein
MMPCGDCPIYAKPYRLRSTSIAAQPAGGTEAPVDARLDASEDSKIFTTRFEASIDPPRKSPWQARRVRLYAPGIASATACTEYSVA